MSNNMENVVLEQVGAIREDMARMAEYLQSMLAEMTTMRQHLFTVVNFQKNDHCDLAALKERLDQLESSLKLTDG